jgi:hypothetical protein
MLPGARRLRIEAAWRSVAGPRLAKRSRARLQEDGSLEVTVAEESWKSAIAAMEPSLLDRLRRTAGGEQPRRLRLRVDPSLPVTREGKEDPAPAQARSDLTPQERLRRVARRHLERRMPGVED